MIWSNPETFTHDLVPSKINAGKTKELVVDLRRRNNPPPAPVNVLGTDVDVVESSKYLGVHLNNNLDWTHNTDALVKKGNSRLFLLRRLRSQGPLLRTFYDSVVGSAIFYGTVCWSSSITDRDRKRMDRLVRRASSVLGCPLDRDRRRTDRLVRRASSVLGCPLDRDRRRTDRLVRRASSVLGCPLDRDRKRMDRLVRRASSVLGCPLDSVEVVGDGRMMAQLSSMLDNTSPPHRTP
ncbi:hypothetical protein D4764_04G0000580 [Takifugu flavidus]|uniref:Alkylated DNA repair protein AlkB homologue 8 N-terminal domain-containing protein n=1 Tax=Takifugu flavidus TaxID=433684 RepID=A0A5C6N1M5_9TELE|nr:hypothetical protein D4764_04G0000580 [Takifugu flavidus]